MEERKNEPPVVQLTNEQRDLQSRLAKAIRDAIPAEIDLDNAERRTQSCYRGIAELLVDLRHELQGPDGEPHDLQGRSHPYRTAVREAYCQAGAEIGSPIPKRLTAGVAYWVRKILIDRYGEKVLYEKGIIRGTAIKVERGPEVGCRRIDELPKDPAIRLTEVISMLNALAVDPRLTPSEEAVLSALRAVRLLQKKLAEWPPDRPSESSVPLKGLQVVGSCQ